MPLKITQEEASKIIETREPLGTFWLTEEVNRKTIYVGIDNRTGDAWTKNLKKKRNCLRWLGK